MNITSETVITRAATFVKDPLNLHQQNQALISSKYLKHVGISKTKSVEFFTSYFGDLLTDFLMLILENFTFEHKKTVDRIRRKFYLKWQTLTMKIWQDTII